MTDQRKMLKAIIQGRLRPGQDLKDAKPELKVEMIFPGPGDPQPWIEAKADVKDEAHYASGVMFSAIVSPSGRLLYVEAVLSSESAGNSMMAMAIEARLQAQWRYYNPGLTPSAICEPSAVLEGPRDAQAFNRRLEVEGYRGFVHHIAILDHSGDLILAKNNDELWAKVRGKLTCPTLPTWGGDLAPKLEGVVVQRCRGFGLPNGLNAYFMASDANASFDSMVGAFVREHGLKE